LACRPTCISVGAPPAAAGTAAARLQSGAVGAPAEAATGGDAAAAPGVGASSCGGPFEAPNGVAGGGASAGEGVRSDVCLSDGAWAPLGAVEAAARWRSIHEKMKPPVCKGHREPCAVRTVKKAGENQGRCPTLPAGPNPRGILAGRPASPASRPHASRLQHLVWVERCADTLCVDGCQCLVRLCQCDAEAL
jgi:hypothetical protein